MSLPFSIKTQQLDLVCDQAGFSVERPRHVDILKNISFSASQGEFVGVIGPNGSGKSTLLRNIGGLLQPTTGQVTLNSQNVKRIGARGMARLSSFMQQNTALPFAFSALDIVRLGRHPYHTPFSPLSAEDEKLVRQCMAAAGCLELSDHLVNTLSGGERQRVMLARILAQDTPLLLLDEPTASLDIHHANEIFRLTRELADRGKLVIAAMHDLRAAAKYCSRLLLVFEGSVVADGDPEEVLHEGHVTYAFGIQAKTFRNPIGQWDFYVDDI